MQKNFEIPAPEPAKRQRLSRRALSRRARVRLRPSAIPNASPPAASGKKVPGVALKVPNFDVLFDQVRAVSPLARQAFEEDATGVFGAVEEAVNVNR